MRGHGIGLALIVAVCLGAFVSALGNEFVWDDELIIVANHGIRDLKHPLKFFTPEYWRGIRADPRMMPNRGYRPLPELLFAVDHAVWGYNPLVYHAMSILVHMGNCVLLYLLALRVLRDTRAATFCALLFAAHPIHVEAVVWAKARSELLAVSFVLAAMLAYCRYIDGGERRRGWALYTASIAAFGLALMCKASAIVLPALFALYLWCYAPRAKWRAGLVGILPFVGVGAAFFAIDSTLPHIPGVVQLEKASPFLTAIAALGVYLKLLVVPAGLCAHHRIHDVRGVLDPLVLRALPLGLALIGGAVVALWRSRVALFAVGWLIIGLAPLSGLQLLGRRVAELRAYLPSIGFCLLVALLLASAPALVSSRRLRQSLQRAGIAVCAFLVIAYTGLSAMRSLDWANKFTLWSDTLSKNGDSWHALAGLSEAYIQNRVPEKAIPYLQHLVELDPMDRSARYRLAAGYQRINDIESAIGVYEYLADEDPEDARAHASLGGLYAKQGQDEMAMQRLERALRVAPRSAYAHRQLGVFHLERGRYDEALAKFEDALVFKSESGATYHMMGLTYVAMGRYTDALEAYRKCLEADPMRVQVWLDIGALHEEMGNVPEALRCYEECTELGGDLAAAVRPRIEELARRAGRGAVP
jgi:tetratricopeptide (TPR) repeat protein